MPDFTPEYDFPYPTGVESPNGPGAFRALAEAVEAELVAQATPPFTDVTFNGAWANFGSTFEEPSYAKIGGRVFLRGTAKHAVTATTGLVFTLPAGFRPTRDRLFIIGAGPGIARITIDSAGLVSVASYVSSGSGASLAFDGVAFDTSA